MWEEKMTSENIVPATLVADEPLIPKETAEKLQDYLENKKTSEHLEETTAITVPNKGGKKKSSLGGVANSDTIGLAEEPAKKPATKAKAKKATVAIYSERNMRWSDVGEIKKGYNIVSPQAAEKWLTRKHVREATPEEVASEYGA
jgi:hypothetical protein